MKQAQPACFRLFALLLFLLLSADASRAQFSRLNDLAAQLEKELKPVKPHLVAVADFRPPYGADLPQGHYFAWLVSDALRARAKKHFMVAEHKSFDADLAKLHITDPLGSDVGASRHQPPDRSGCPAHGFYRATRQQLYSCGHSGCGHNPKISRIVPPGNRGE